MRHRGVGVIGGRGGLIKGMMDGCELCIEARDEFFDVLSVLVGMCDIGSKGGVNVSKADEDGFD